jgi:hypothetical protein
VWSTSGFPAIHGYPFHFQNGPGTEHTLDAKETCKPGRASLRGLFLLSVLFYWPIRRG